MKKVLIIAVTIVAVIALGNVVLASAQVSNQPGPQNGTCPLRATPARSVAPIRIGASLAG